MSTSLITSTISGKSESLVTTKPVLIAWRLWKKKEDLALHVHFAKLLIECAKANQLAALQTLDLHPGLLNRPWGEFVLCR